MVNGEQWGQPWLFKLCACVDITTIWSVRLWVLVELILFFLVWSNKPEHWLASCKKKMTLKSQEDATYLTLCYVGISSKPSCWWEGMNRGRSHPHRSLNESDSLFRLPLAPCNSSDGAFSAIFEKVSLQSICTVSLSLLWATIFFKPTKTVKDRDSFEWSF